MSDLTTEPTPSVEIIGGSDPRPTTGLVIVLHGGRSRGRQPATGFRLTHRRMVPFAKSLERAGRQHGLAVWMLRYRYRGWNGSAQDPVQDARWALLQASARHPRTPVVLVEHSMGGRTALYAAGAENVVAVAALAPWIEPGDPVRQLAGRSLLIAHGDRERMTSPTASYEYATEARDVAEEVARFDVLGDGHAMLRRSAEWHRLVTRYVLGALGMEPQDPRITNAFHTPAPDGLRVPLTEEAR